MSRHIIRAEVETNGGACVKLDIEFQYHPGTPQRGPSYASGGEPAEGPELEFLHATLIDGDGLDPSSAQLQEWAEDWLDSDDGHDAACDLACDEGGA